MRLKDKAGDTGQHGCSLGQVEGNLGGRCARATLLTGWCKDWHLRGTCAQMEHSPLTAATAARS